MVTMTSKNSVYFRYNLIQLVYTFLFFELNKINAKKLVMLRRLGYHRNDNDVSLLWNLYPSDSDFYNSVLFAVQNANIIKKIHPKSTVDLLSKTVGIHLKLLSFHDRQQNAIILFTIWYQPNFLQLTYLRLFCWYKTVFFVIQKYKLYV